MSSAQPLGGYLVCASPRSGSTLLCDLLTRSGVAGAPQSYFRPASIPDFARSWGLSLGQDESDEWDEWDAVYVRNVREHGEAGTGRFGMRIMWSDMPVFVERLATLYPDHHTDIDRLRSALGVEHFVHLVRADRVAQAVSLVIATQSGVWHRDADGSDRERSASTAPVHYDHDQIADELQMLDDEAAGWRDWFDAAGITPLALTYEQLAADAADGVAGVLSHIGSDALALPAPGTSRLATEMNHEWAARFRAESASPPGRSTTAVRSTSTRHGGAAGQLRS